MSEGSTCAQVVLNGGNSSVGVHLALKLAKHRQIPQPSIDASSSIGTGQKPSARDGQ